MAIFTTFSLVEVSLVFLLEFTLGTQRCLVGCWMKILGKFISV